MPAESTAWVRPTTTRRSPPKAAKRPRPVWTLFYGVPVEEVQRICGVSKSTAYSYKNGNRKPSKAIAKLMQLHNAGRVLEPKFWPTGWRFHEGTVVDPEGNITTEAQLRGYGMLMQTIMHHVRQNEVLRAEVEPILRIMEGGARRA